MQSDLFQTTKTPPLAHRVRPRGLEGFYGQEKIFRRYPFLTRGPTLPSVVFWGPSGCGKTTLAQLLAEHHGLNFYPFQAVLSGVGELKKLIAQGKNECKPFVIFIDEIHRFNKAQQDALLPLVEQGDFILMGATTENPKATVNRALLSRMQIVQLQALDETSIKKILGDAIKKLPYQYNDEIVQVLAKYAVGDARKALNALELLRETSDPQKALDIIQESSRHYDRLGDRHYDVISAFIKSLRGSDPDAALLWLAIMLDGGEDPAFISRRLVIFASEDVGNADPQALVLASSAMQAVEKIGMPEARIILGQTVTYLARAKKSNASYVAIDKALSYVREHPNISVPTHLRNHHPDKSKYRYPHNYPNAQVSQDYGPPDLKFYKSD